MEVLWDGPCSTDKLACPYDVRFIIKPGLDQSLNSLESGRLIITVELVGSSDIREVCAELVNHARSKRFDVFTESSESDRKISVDTILSRKENSDIWTGELSIPAIWTEGCSMTYERTGSFTQTQCANIFSLNITYLMTDGMRCTALFDSHDAFHWSAIG